MVEQSFDQSWLMNEKQKYLPPWSGCFFFHLSKYDNVAVLLFTFMVLIITSFFLRPAMPLWLVE